MKKKLLSLLLLGGLTLTAGAQQVNGSFDATWENCVPWTSNGNTSKKGTEPVGWTISHVIGMGGTGATVVAASTTGRGESGLAVKLTNTPNPLSSSQIVPAYLSLGTTWATSTGLLTIKNKDGGTFGGMEFSYKPDALRFYYKRSHGTADADEPAVVCAYLWSGRTLQANVPGNNASISYNLTKVTMINRDRNILGMTTSQGGAVTKDNFTLIGYLTDGTNKYVQFGSSDVSEWTEFKQEFKYDSDFTPSMINIILSANDYFAGADAVGKDNSLIVDDVALIYYSTLKSLTYDGSALDIAAAAAGTLDMSTVSFDESLLEYSKNGVGATAEHVYDESTGILTITVSNAGADEDGKSSHTYTIKFKKVEPLKLLTANFNGTNLTVKAGDLIMVDAVYSSENWTFTTSGEHARVIQKYDVESGILSLIVWQFDGDGMDAGPTENFVEYYYMFQSPEDVKIYNETLIVSFLDEVYTSTSPIKIAKMSDGTYILGLSDFKLGELPVGDIVVDGLTKETINGIETFKSNGSTTIEKTIRLAPGNVYDYAAYLGPVLGDVPISMQTENYGEYFHTVIGINMEESLGYNIDVTAGTDIVAQTQSAALTETGEAHVVLNRQFLKGWNTICLPFATTPEAVAGTGAKAQAFAGADADGLDFVVAETMTANTPYLIYVPADTEAQTFIASVNLEEATPASVTYGDFTFNGNYVANMPMADLYGVADKDGVQKIMKGSATAKLQGTRAYFDYSGASSVSGMRLNLEGQDDVTSIDGVEVMNGSFDIYNLQGIRVRTAATSLEGLGRGVYVVNGKKVMVK